MKKNSPGLTIKMSRGYDEPLLREMHQIEAPQQSTLSKALSKEMNDSRQMPLVPSQRVLVVHYWSPTGQHSCHQLTATQQRTVRDVMQICLDHFAIPDDIGLFQLKLANKNGEAKDDLPRE